MDIKMETSFFAVLVLPGAIPGPPQPVLEFKVDRPFHYMILDRNAKVPLFAGNIVKPRKE